MTKQYSPACDQNKAPILTIIKPLLTKTTTLLEIGSGTGQHAVYFAKAMPHLTWQASDVLDNIPSINAWLLAANLTNTLNPLSLDVNDNYWLDKGQKVEAIFSANTTHIMDIDSVIALFVGVGASLKTGGVFLLYGPFNYNGHYTSQSNAQFDLWLRSRNTKSAIRNFETLEGFAQQNALKIQSDTAMPANNRLLCWVKQ